MTEFQKALSGIYWTTLETSVVMECSLFHVSYKMEVMTIKILSNMLTHSSILRINMNRVKRRTGANLKMLTILHSIWKNFNNSVKWTWGQRGIFFLKHLIQIKEKLLWVFNSREHWKYQQLSCWALPSDYQHQLEGIVLLNGYHNKSLLLLMLNS